MDFIQTTFLKNNNNSQRGYSPLALQHLGSIALRQSFGIGLPDTEDFQEEVADLGGALRGFLI